MSSAILPIAYKPEIGTAASTNARAVTDSSVAAAAADPAVGHVPYPNPSLHIDDALGLVVMEFYNSNGALATSIPTSAQLEAYRRSGAEVTATTSSGGQTPAPMPAATSTMPSTGAAATAGTSSTDIAPVVA